MILEDVLQFLKKNPPFQLLDDATLKSVAGGLSMQFYPKETVILKQDGPPSDAVWIIKKGGIKVLMRSDDGEEAVIDYRGEGDTFGFLSLIGKDRQKTTVVTIDDTICYILKKEKVLKLLESSPAFSEYFMSYLSRYVDKTYKEMHTKSLFYGSSDRVLFTTRVGDIASEVVTASDETSIQEAAQIMAKRKVSSLIILDRRNLPVGIITDKDLREKVVAKGRSITEPVKNIMAISLIRIEAGEPCFEAVLKMLKYKIHHLLVLHEGELKGIMTNHDLMLLQGVSPLSLTHNVENQQEVEGLISISSKVNSLVGLLLKEGAKAGSILTIITEINDRMMKKVLEFAERKFGSPPVPYTWIVFGSEGRREQLFKTDQDNAIIYADPGSKEDALEAERYFSAFTPYVQECLLKIGYPPCSSGHMASNPKWCRPLADWKSYFRVWMNASSYEDIIRALTFFDLRPIYGKFSLAEELRDSFFPSLPGSVFLGSMASVIMKNIPLIGFLKSFVVEKSGEHKDELDLKQKGTIPMVDILRLLALDHGVKETSTFGRIASLKVKHPVVREHASELEHVYEFMLLLRIHHQYSQIMAGIKPDNFINPNTLSTLEKKTMREAFHLISKLHDAIKEQYKTFIRYE